MNHYKYIRKSCQQRRKKIVEEEEKSPIKEALIQ